MGTNDDNDEHYDVHVIPSRMAHHTLAHSIVKKKNRLRMYWPRGLILTNEPRLYYYKPPTFISNIVTKE